MCSFSSIQCASVWFHAVEFRLVECESIEFGWMWSSLDQLICFGLVTMNAKNIKPEMTLSESSFLKKKQKKRHAKWWTHRHRTPQTQLYKKKWEKNAYHPVWMHGVHFCYNDSNNIHFIFDHSMRPFFFSEIECRDRIIIDVYWMQIHVYHFDFWSFFWFWFDFDLFFGPHLARFIFQALDFSKKSTKRKRKKYWMLIDAHQLDFCMLFGTHLAGFIFEPLDFAKIIFIHILNIHIFKKIHKYILCKSCVPFFFWKLNSNRLFLFLISF